MSENMKWVIGVVMGLVALVGLIMASQARDDVFYFVGLLFFAFGVLFDYALIAAAGGRRLHSSGD